MQYHTTGRKHQNKFKQAFSTAGKKIQSYLEFSTNLYQKKSVGGGGITKIFSWGVTGYGCPAGNFDDHPIAKGRTPLIRAPIGFYAKVRVFKARFESEAAIF